MPDDEEMSGLLRGLDEALSEENVKKRAECKDREDFGCALMRAFSAAGAVMIKVESRKVQIVANDVREAWKLLNDPALFTGEPRRDYFLQCLRQSIVRICPASRPVLIQ